MPACPEVNSTRAPFYVQHLWGICANPGRWQGNLPTPRSTFSANVETALRCRSIVNSAPLLTLQQLTERSCHDLDWSLLLDRLAGFTTSPAGGRRLRARPMEPSFELALASMQRTQETLSLVDDGLSLPVGDLPDLGDLLCRLERSAVATGIELRDLGRMLEQSRTLRLFALSQKLQRPNLSSQLLSDPALDKLLERLRQSIENDGTLSDRASPALGRLRAKVREFRQELVSHLKRVIHTHADLLRDQYFSERDGRYVIPVRADAHRAIEGTVLDTSASGNTLFVEPRELSPHNNRLRVALAEVNHEEQRLFQELSALAKDAAPGLHVAENACIEADVLAAFARFAHLHGAHAVLPTRERRLVLLSMRHPLLVGQLEAVVPNDLELSAGQALVVSGPNAGGKTVSLKALGLFAMMARAGLPMTVDETSKLGYFDEIFCDIGDSQSIVSSLSTFSAHILDLASILAQTGPGSLVLLDEVAGGTDPEQGSALAAAYLEALLDQGAAVAATTHYEVLKELGNHDPRFRNAAVGFDVKSLLPSFRILLGIAGPSTALAVAQRFGLPHALIARAESLVPKDSRAREKLLEQLTAERDAAQTLRFEAERDAREQRRLRLELEAERDAAKATFQRQLDQEYRELLGRIRVSRTELDALKKRLLADGQAGVTFDRASLLEAERTVDLAAHTVALGSPVAEAIRAARQAGHPQPPAIEASCLVVGKRIFVPRLGMDAEILEISRKGTLKVRAGSLTLTVSAEDARTCSKASSVAKPSPGSRSPKKRGTTPSRTEPLAPRNAPVRFDNNTLDLRGERVDAALDRVDAFVDELLRRSEPAGFVLHGHGTGALKQAVREHVRSLKNVVDSGPASPEDGGDAFTLLWLGD